MTPRQRILNALNHLPVDKPPFALGFGLQPPAKRDLAAHLGMNMAEVEEFLTSRSDIRNIWPAPKYIGPPDRCATRADGSNTDVWGVIRAHVSYGPGHYDEICHYPLADITNVSQLDDYVFPSPDWYDYSSIPERIREINRDTEHAILLGGGNLFERSWYMRGFETLLADLLVEKEIVHGIMSRVTDFFVEYATRALEAANGEADLYFTADDIGGQDGLLMSLPLWEEMIKPYHVRLNKALKKFNVKIVYHTDGAIMDALDGLVDMGIDVVEALQFDARGMDPAEMKRRVGGKIGFHGGVSVQSTLPFGTPQEVEAEVRERIKILGEGGGYICAPSHAIQAGTPPENVLAFFRAAGRL